MLNSLEHDGTNVLCYAKFNTRLAFQTNVTLYVNCSTVNNIATFGSKATNIGKTDWRFTATERTGLNLG